MDLERWDQWLEHGMAVLIGIAMGWAVFAFGGVRVQDFLIVEILVGLALVLWVVRLWFVPSHRLLWPPVCWGVLIFLGWAAWRAVEAPVGHVAWAEWMRIATYGALFFVTVNNLHRQETAQRIAWSLVAMATLLCFYGAWQFATNDNTVLGAARSPNYARRASGFYFNPNHFAGLLEMLLPLAITTVIAGRMKPLGRVVLGYAALVMLAGLALTFSRAGWIAAAVGLGFVLVALARNRDYRWPAIACLGVLLLGAGVVASRSAVLAQRIQTSHDLDPEARNSRPQIWRCAIAMWRDHPWFGVGPAHFNERFPQYRPERVHGEPRRAHNDYLDALADWGVAGAALIALPWLLLAYGVARTLRQVRRDPGDLEVKRSGRYSFVLGAAAGLLALLVHAFADFNFHVPANAMVAVALMGFLTGYSRYATDDWWVSSRWPWRILVTVFIALPLLAVLGWDLSRRVPEVRRLERAHDAPPLSDKQLEEFQAAWTANPTNPWTAGYIGEVYRLRSFAGMAGHEELAREALRWFERASQLNPFQAVFHTRAGLCLNWLGDFEAAEKEFEIALKLDPNGIVTSYQMGWHKMNQGDTAAAREWFDRSANLGWPPYQPALDALRRLNELETPPTPPATPPSPSTDADRGQSPG